MVCHGKPGLCRIDLDNLGIDDGPGCHERFPFVIAQSRMENIGQGQLIPRAVGMAGFRGFFQENYVMLLHEPGCDRDYFRPVNGKANADKIHLPVNSAVIYSGLRGSTKCFRSSQNLVRCSDSGGC